MDTDLRTAAQQAIEVMQTNAYAVVDVAPHQDVMAYYKAISALADALAEPPCATQDCMPSECRNCTSLEAQNTELDRKLAELSERRLTDEVIADLWHANGGFHHHFARALERWLRGQA